MTSRQFLDQLLQLPPELTALLAPIKTEAQLEAIEEVIDSLSAAIGDDLTHPLAGLYRNLILLATTYEAAAYPFALTPPHRMLAFLLEQRGMRQAQLAQHLGTTQASVSRLVNGQTAFTAELIKQLAGVFRVSGNIFLN
ncbi:helix-turn-helix domain-containing protein [Deinococcus sp.]|uniref:helix-turn-helix domain-containing protein n=1 Tax=Deinococcus sp. TaxID=47478 RepID=UPI003B5A242D